MNWFRTHSLSGGTAPCI